MAGILILGGTGVFGMNIAATLCRDAELQVTVTGRTRPKSLAGNIRFQAVKLPLQLVATLENLRPDIVINCVGPFQGQNYDVATACIQRGFDYIDLSDAREYVHGFAQLDTLARQHDVVAISGASTVPAVSSAVIEDVMARNPAELDTLEYAISPGNQTPRGIATVAAILSYVGKSFTHPEAGKPAQIYGWQGMRRWDITGIGKRWLGYCNIPDLALFPEKYPSLKTIRFYAGLELPVLHLGLWALSWLIRWRIVPTLLPFARIFTRISLWLYRFGSNTGFMQMRFAGTDADGQPFRTTWTLIARHGDGPKIPAIPAILLCRKIVAKAIAPGAYPAVGLLTLAEIRDGFDGFAIDERFT